MVASIKSTSESADYFSKLNHCATTVATAYSLQPAAPKVLVGLSFPPLPPPTNRNMTPWQTHLTRIDGHIGYYVKPI
jgi:hypothetical protein